MGRTVGNSSKIRLAISMISRDHNMAITISGRGRNRGFKPHLVLHLSSKMPPCPTVILLAASESVFFDCSLVRGKNSSNNERVSSCR